MHFFQLAPVNSRLDNGHIPARKLHLQNSFVRNRKVGAVCTTCHLFAVRGGGEQRYTRHISKVKSTALGLLVVGSALLWHYKSSGPPGHDFYVVNFVLSQRPFGSLRLSDSCMHNTPILSRSLGGALSVMEEEEMKPDIHGYLAMYAWILDIQPSTHDYIAL